MVERRPREAITEHIVRARADAIEVFQACRIHDLAMGVELLVNQKFLWVAGVIIGAIPIMYAGLLALKKQSLNDASIGFIGAVAGAAILLLTFAFTTKAMRK